MLLLDPHNEHTVEITDVASLPDIHDDVDVTLTGHSQLETLTICCDLPVNVEAPRDEHAFYYRWQELKEWMRVERQSRVEAMASHRRADILDNDILRWANINFYYLIHNDLTFPSVLFYRALL